MSALVRIAGFGAVLALAFAAAALAGSAIDPDPRAGEDGGAHAENGATATGGHGSSEAEAEAGAHGEAADPVRGLAVAEDGLQLTVADDELRRGSREQLRFAIVDATGATVRDFDVEHEKRMHLIVVRRDLTGFQHLHPTQAADGMWSVPITVAEAGSYRMLADFTRGGEAHTLAADLRVDGRADLAPLPAPSDVAVSDGDYDVRLDAGAPRAGAEADLRFSVRSRGEPVRTEPYLGAGGHLVALREGDLAFLHVHPSDDDVAFAATFPSAGRYRLFLQFKHDGRVQTVAFTQAVAR